MGAILEMTLAQIRALSEGHLDVEAMSERRQIQSQRMAFWGSDEDVSDYLADLAAPSGDTRSNTAGASDVETALAAFGLKEE